MYFQERRMNAIASGHQWDTSWHDAAAAAKSRQSSPTVRPHRWQPTRLPCPQDSPGKNTGVGCHFLLQCMKVKSESEVAQSCLTLSDPMECSPPGSSVHGIFLGCHCLLPWHDRYVIFVELHMKVKVLVTYSCPTLCNTMDSSPPSSSVHGILQARIMEWLAIPFSRGSSQPRDWTQVSCITGRFFTIWATWKSLNYTHTHTHTHTHIYIHIHIYIYSYWKPIKNHW